MQEILELQKRLKEVQSMPSKSVQRLNERNVVDIVLKIVEKQKLQLLYSSDGKDYITPEYLQKDILNLVEENGGRLALPSICSHLNINFDVVENAANSIASSSAIQIINGDLMTPAYIDTVVEEISEVLNDKGLLAISEPSSKYEIPLDFIKKALSVRMHILPAGSQLEGNILQTQTFADRQVCKIRGFMRSITKPTAMSQLTQKLNTNEQTLKNTIERLVKESTLKGKINKGVFVPESFALLQTRTVCSFYQQNQYVEYSLLDKMYVTQNQQQFLEKALSNEIDDPVYMDKFALSDSLYSSIKNQIQQAERDSLYLNLVELLPDCFKTPDDTHDFLAKIHTTMKLLSDESHLVSAGFLDKCMALFVSQSEAHASKNLKGGMRPTKLVEKDKITQQHKEQDKVKKAFAAERKKSGGKRGKRQQQEDDQEEEKSNEHICMKFTPFKQIQIKEMFENANNIKNLLPQEIDELLMDPLIEFLEEPIAKQFWQIFMQASELTSTKSSAQTNVNVEQDAEAQFQSLKYVLKQFDNVKKRFDKDNEDDFEQIIAPIKAHLCKVQLTDLLNKLITIQAFHNDINLQNCSEAKNLSKNPITKQNQISTINDRQLITSKFQAHIKEIFVELGVRIKENRFNEYFDIIAENIKNLAVRLGKQGVMDKKVEKATKQKLMNQFVQPVEEWMQSIEAEGLPSEKTDSVQLISSLKRTTSQALNWLLILQGFYLGLSSEQVLCEEWAIRVTIRVVIRMNPDKEELCQGIQSQLFTEDGRVDAQAVHALLDQLIKTFSQ